MRISPANDGATDQEKDLCRWIMLQCLELQLSVLFGVEVFTAVCCNRRRPD